MDDALERLRRELGGLSIELAHFETALGCAVGFLANPKEAQIGMVLVAELSLKARLTLFSALWMQRLPNAANDPNLKAFRRGVHLVEQARNTLIHSTYWPPSSGGESATRLKVTAKERQGLRLHVEDVTAVTVSQLTQQLKPLTESLDALIGRFFPAEYQHYLDQYYFLLGNADNVL